MTIEEIRRYLGYHQANRQVLNRKLERNKGFQKDLVGRLKEAILAGNSTGNRLDDFLIATREVDPVTVESDHPVARLAVAMAELETKIKAAAGGPVLATWYERVCTKHVFAPGLGNENQYEDRHRFAVGKLAGNAVGILLDLTEGKGIMSLPTEAYVDNRSNGVHAESLGKLGAFADHHFSLVGWLSEGKGSLYVGAEEIAACLDTAGGELLGHFDRLMEMFHSLGLALPPSKRLNPLRQFRADTLRQALAEVRSAKTLAVARAGTDHVKEEEQLLAQMAKLGVEPEEAPALATNP